MASFLLRSMTCSLLALPLLACGDDGSAEDGGASSTGTSASTTAGPGTTAGDATAADTTGIVTGTTESPEETSDTSGGSTAGATDSTDGSAGSTGSTGEGTDSTGEPGNAVYSAVAIPGGLDRIRINKADFDNDRCTWVILVAPPIMGPYPGLTVPAGWSVESISINDVAAACDADNPAMFGSEPALDASGTVGFGMLGGTGIYPCTLDIDATFDFQGVLPGIPPTDDMVAVDVPVTGC